MKNIKVFVLCTSMSILIFSCQKKDVAEEVQQKEVQQKTIDKQVSKIHKKALFDAGVNPQESEYVTVKHPGEKAFRAIKSGDIIIPLDRLDGQKLVTTENQDKQYRTYNLVDTSNGRVITIVGYTGRGYALTSKMRTALQWAVNNYNRLNTSLYFDLRFDASTSADMVVYNNGKSGGGGSAGFPWGGDPHKYIQINQGTNNYSTNVVEHVITHEIGHSVGFRHQDYRTRQSCGQNVNEGEAGVGAIQIGNTPTSDWADSIMLACFSGSEDGEFSYSDVEALNILY